jgi:hypothetical protein
LRKLRHGLCMSAIQRVKHLSAFECSMVVGARRTGLSVSRTATLLVFSPSTVFRVYEDHPMDMESTWASIPVVHFRHLVESMPRHIEAVLRAKGCATKY